MTCENLPGWCGTFVHLCRHFDAMCRRVWDTSQPIQPHGDDSGLSFFMRSWTLWAKQHSGFRHCCSCYMRRLTWPESLLSSLGSISNPTMPYRFNEFWRFLYVSVMIWWFRAIFEYTIRYIYFWITVMRKPYSIHLQARLNCVDAWCARGKGPPNVCCFMTEPCRKSTSNFLVLQDAECLLKQSFFQNHHLL